MANDNLEIQWQVSDFLGLPKWIKILRWPLMQTTKPLIFDYNFVRCVLFKDHFPPLHLHCNHLSLEHQACHTVGSLVSQVKHPLELVYRSIIAMDLIFIGNSDIVLFAVPCLQHPVYFFFRLSAYCRNNCEDLSSIQCITRSSNICRISYTHIHWWQSIDFITHFSYLI